MARSPASPDILDQIRRLREEVRQLRLAVRPHAETKTFIVAGDIEFGLWIPPVLINANPDQESPETKRLLSFHGSVRTGSITLDWYLNEELLLAGHAVSTSGSTGGTSDDLIAAYGELPLLRGENWLRVAIASGTAADLAAAFTVITGR